MTSTSGLDHVLQALTASRPQVVATSTADRTATAVRDQITEGLLRSGMRLPEEQLGRALGVSRNTLREALSQLVSERILLREPNRGVFVATPSREDVLDLYRIRLLIEPAAVRHGEHFDEVKVAVVSAAVAEGQEAAGQGRWDDVASANQHFHRGLVAFGGSVRLDSQMSLLLAEMRLVFHRMGTPKVFHAPYLDRNEAIAALLVAGERAAAADALVDYLHAAEQQLLTAYDNLC